MAERGSIEEVGDDFLLRISGILGPLSAAAKALAMKERVTAAGADAIVVWDRSRGMFIVAHRPSKVEE